uniref:Uncharacterized protein n=1 Tax=Setaria digitata TaxID=48799 RepID=A0A915Q4I7_9BILA
MSKEDYERDRLRWQQKLDDTSKRLADAEIINSEMNQIKAELKDDYERLVKDNQSLKERRAFPEKLEELDRYRNQVLEYSKCITALRQAGLEKDRRYDLLVQKFKRLRKCISSRKSGETEEDRQSSFGGSDCSAESSISLNTITEDLNETLDKDIENGYHQIAREGEQLRRTLSALKTGEYGLEDEQLLRHQLICAQTTIAQQQMVIEQQQLQCVSRRLLLELVDLQLGSMLFFLTSVVHYSQLSLLKPGENHPFIPLVVCRGPSMYSSENTMELLDSIARLQDQVMKQRSKMESMEAELVESKEMNELLEFQLLENKENMEHEFEERRILKEAVSKDTMTESWISEEDECTFLSQMPPLPDFEEVCNRKCELINLRRSSSLNVRQRELVQQMLIYIEHLEDRLLQLKIDTEQKLCQFTSEQSESAAKIQDLEEQVEKSHSKEKKKNVSLFESHLESEQRNKVVDLEREVEALRKREFELDSEKQMLNSEVNRMSREMGKLRYLLQQKEEQLTRQSNKDSEQESRIVELETEKRCITDENNELRCQLRQYTESLTDFKELLAKKEEEMGMLEKEYAALQSEHSNALDEIQRLQEDMRPAVKTDLERRFEEYRYRLSCALTTVHEYEDEISKLRSRLAKLESKDQERNDDTAKELEQIREYSEQLEEQFTAQVGIIEALKRKIVQQKALTDFLWDITESDELSLAKVEEKLNRFKLSQQHEGDCQLTEAVQKLIRLLLADCDYSYKTLPATLS